MKVGLFGGTYNPIHTAHLIIAEWIRDFLDLDSMFLMPTAHPPHKRDETGIIGIEHRIKMVRLAVESEPGLNVADFESDPEATVYSIDTVRHFLHANPDAEGNLFFIIGEDNFRTLGSWKDPVGLSRLCTIVVARRSTGTADLPPEGIEGALIVDTPHIDISASMVRERVRTGRSIRYLVPAPVASYIEKHGLYK